MCTKERTMTNNSENVHCSNQGHGKGEEAFFSITQRQFPFFCMPLCQWMRKNGNETRGNEGEKFHQTTITYELLPVIDIQLW